MTTPVSFELAKLLKEKGFDVPCEGKYLDGTYFQSYFGKTPNEKYQDRLLQAPTIAEVVMWLWKKHEVWISVDMVFEETQTGFWYCIRQSKMDDVAIQSNDYNSPTEAYEAAIEHVLTKVVKK